MAAVKRFLIYAAILALGFAAARAVRQPEFQYYPALPYNGEFKVGYVAMAAFLNSERTPRLVWTNDTATVRIPFITAGKWEIRPITNFTSYVAGNDPVRNQRVFSKATEAAIDLNPNIRRTEFSGVWKMAVAPGSEEFTINAETLYRKP